MAYRGMEQVSKEKCVKHPFGFPVEPDVYKMNSGSSENCSVTSHLLL